MLISKENITEINIDLSYLKRTFNQEIEYLKKHIDICTETTSAQNIIIRNELLEKIEEEPERESEFNTLYETKIRTISCHFYHSSILLIYANLENTLNSICNYIEERTESPLLSKNIRAYNDILKFKSFFSITSDLGTLIDDFTKFDNYRLLRNSIAHNNSTVRKATDYNKLKQSFLTGIEFDDSQNVFFIESNNLPFQLLNEIKTFIINLCDTIESKKYISFREINNN